MESRKLWIEKRNFTIHYGNSIKITSSVPPQCGQIQIVLECMCSSCIFHAFHPFVKPINYRTNVCSPEKLSKYVHIKRWSETESFTIFFCLFWSQNWSTFYHPLIHRNFPQYFCSVLSQNLIRRKSIASLQRLT